MALTTCKECKAQISSKAKSCPTCGSPTQPKLSMLQIGFVVLLTTGVVAGVASGAKSSPEPTPPSAEQAASNARAAEAERIEANKTRARFAFASDAVKAVLGSLRDPDSAKFTYLAVNENATVACLQYRAKNGFGGYGSDIAVIANNKATKSQADWKKYCGGPMRDLLAAAS